MSQFDTEQALKRLAVLVKNHRAETGKTVREYAKLFGDLNPSITSLEKAQYMELPKHKTLVRFAEILRMDYWQLIKYLQYGETPDSPIPERLTKEQIVVGIRRTTSLNEALDIHWESANQVERCRFLAQSVQNQDL